MICVHAVTLLSIGMIMKIYKGWKKAKGRVVEWEMGGSGKERHIQ